MARTDITTDSQNAADGYAVNAVVSAKIYKTRQYFVYADLDVASNPFAPEPEIQTAPLGEDVKWSPRTYDIYSVYADSDVIKLETASSGLQTLSTAGSPLDTLDQYRPSIWTMDAGEQIWFADTDGIHMANMTGYTVDDTNLLYGTATSAMDWYQRNPPAALHAIDEDEAIALWINDGGVSCTYLYHTAGSPMYSDWGFRFIDPTNVQDVNDTTDTYNLHYSAAVKDGDGNIYVYLTRYDGSVDGLVRWSNGEWSDRRIAVPADLSEFKCTNAFIAPNGYIALVGQFQRVDDTGAFSSDFIYNLISMSVDGKTFSMDRNTLIAMGNEDLAGNSMGYRFFAGVDTASPLTNLWISSCGSWASDTAPLYLDDNAEYIQIDGDDASYMRGPYSGGIGIRLPDSTGAYIDNASIHNGAVIDLYLDYMIADGSRESTLVRRSIIDNIEEELSERGRYVTIDTEPFSMWMAGEMTHPFYLELQSKQSIYDDVDQWDNLYEANSDAGLPAHLAVDLWSDKNVTPTEHAAGNKATLLTEDLRDIIGYTVYPKVPSLPFEVSVYGWSRTGSNTPYTGGSGDQPSDSNADTDLITLRIIVERGASGNETEYDIEVTDISSTYSRFPRTWYTSEAGSYPIVFSCGSGAGLVEGDTIKRIGVYSENVNGTDDTLYFIERIESTDIAVQLPMHGEIWSSSEFEEQFGDPDNFMFDDGDMDWYYLPYWPPYGWNPAYPYWQDGRLYLDGTGGGPFYETGRWKYDYVGDVYFPAAGEPWSITISGKIDHYESGIIIGAVGKSEEYEIQIDIPNITPGNPFVLNQTTDPDYAGRKLVSITWGAIFGFSGYDYEYLESVETTGLIGVSPPSALTAQTLLRAGVPIVRFSTKPYTTFNCEVAAAYNITNSNLRGGVVLLGSDGNNYITAYAEKGTITLSKVRDAVETILATESYSFSGNKFWIMAKHIDGEINVYISEGFSNPNYGDPELTYVWTEDDEEICTSDDIMHVGTYSMIDTPWVKVTGWSPGETNYMGILPESIGDLSGFPSSGTLLVNGKEISYTGKVSKSNAYGPYQCRNTTNWPSYSRDGHSYSGGNAIEFTRFEWADDSVNYNRYNGYLMASNIGEAHIITASDFKPWITTGGKLVILKNRMRCFASDIDDNVHGFSEKMYITGGFSGVQNEGDEEYTVMEGDIAFLYGDDYLLQLLGFVASSEHEDATVEDMIEKILYMSGAVPDFPGDTLISSQALSSSETEIT